MIKKYFEVGRKLCDLYHIVRFDVVPAPDELIEGVFFTLSLGQNFWVFLGIIYLSELFQSYPISNYFLDTSVGIFDSL